MVAKECVFLEISYVSNGQSRLGTSGRMSISVSQNESPRSLVSESSRVSIKILHYGALPQSEFGECGGWILGIYLTGSPGDLYVHRSLKITSIDHLGCMFKTQISRLIPLRFWSRRRATDSVT